MRYRTRHTVVEAMIWNGPNDTESVKCFVGNREVVSDFADGNLKFCTYNEKKRTFFAEPGDYIVKAADNSFHIFKPDAFHNLFSAVHKDADERGIRHGDIEIYIGTNEGELAPCRNVILNGKSLPILDVDDAFSLRVCKVGMPAQIKLAMYATRIADNWKGEK